MIERKTRKESTCLLGWALLVHSLVGSRVKLKAELRTIKRFSIFFLLAFLSIVINQEAALPARLVVGNTEGTAGEPGLSLPVQLISDGADGLAAIQVDLEYNSSQLNRVEISTGESAQNSDQSASFANGVTVRSESSYRARLRHNETVVTCFYGQGITLEGFDIAHSGAGAGALVIQIQDLIGEPGGDDYVSRITLRNNILHDSFNNDILKINNGAGRITVEGKMFYNQSGSDEHIDVNSDGQLDAADINRIVDQILQGP